ncbi:MAG: hypothetical protein R3C16_12830 [Hyphomonadaceae bacterium]
MTIAAEAKRLYDPARHDPKPIAAQAMLELRADLGAGRITADDEALFQANIRALFREHPEELAGLCGYIGQESYPLYPKAMSRSGCSQLGEDVAGECASAFLRRQPSAEGGDPRGALALKGTHVAQRTGGGGQGARFVRGMPGAIMANPSEKPLTVIDATRTSRPIIPRDFWRFRGLLRQMTVSVRRTCARRRSCSITCAR